MELLVFLSTFILSFITGTILVAAVGSAAAGVALQGAALRYALIGGTVVGALLSLVFLFVLAAASSKAKDNRNPFQDAIYWVFYSKPPAICPLSMIVLGLLSVYLGGR